MGKTIQEIFLEARNKARQKCKIDNGIIYEIVPPYRSFENVDSGKLKEEDKAERDLAFQNRIRGISNLPSVSNMNVKPLPLPLQSSSLSSNLIQDAPLKAEKRYCPYCCTVSYCEENICSNCGLPIPEKEYRREENYSGSSLSLDIGNMLYNIENEIEPPSAVSIETAFGNRLEIKPIMTEEKFVRYYPSYENRINVYCTLNKYTVIDFETANMYPDSVCAMGIITVEDNEVTERKSYLIRPPYNDFRNSHIHGITLSDVVNEKTFFELWEEIKPYIENKLVGAYNARFDIGCLLATLENYEIEKPDFAYFDIMQSVREKYEFGSYKLSTVARRLKIKYKEHDALSDAQAAYEVQKKCDMGSTFSMMYAKGNNHFEVMTELFTSKDIMSFIRKRMKENTSSEVEEYKKELYLLQMVEKRNEDKAKILKLRGELFEKCGKVDEALSNYKEAYSLNDKIGVKGRIEKLEKGKKK